MTDPQSVAAIGERLQEGLSQPKCRQCGCMKDVLLTMEALASVSPGDAGDLPESVARGIASLQPIKYACLGCEPCIAADVSNAFTRAFPAANIAAELSCACEPRPAGWPAVPGDYRVLGEGPIAISTLASLDLPDMIAAARPPGVCIVGKTETENIGLDKVIRNVVSNPTIRYLILTGEDAPGHLPGQTLLALATNGVDDGMRVIGSRGVRPVLRNVTRGEVEAFRRQVQVVDMIGCGDLAEVLSRTAELAEPAAAASCECGETASACGCGCCETTNDDSVRAEADSQVILVQGQDSVKLDPAGYFVVLPQPDQRAILVEHYGYDNSLLHTIQGTSARDLYLSIVDRGWVGELSHAAYLGKELARAELSMELHFRYVQDAA